MASECSNCSRAVAVSGAAFCSFCGERLSDPHATIDHLNDAPAEALRETVPDEPRRVGGYRIVRHLGEGGMGSVFEAEADESGQRVAVKLLSTKLSSNPLSVERFKQEGRLASQISHPRCVFVYRADADEGRPFIVMELMPGLTLKDMVERQGRLSPTDAVTRILDVVDGLIEAHRLGLIHRDVKPSNCFLTADDRVKVGDFGLSKSLIESEGDGQLTGTGAFLGTVLFASPEQIRGEDVSYDSDVYSVCATLYYLLAGRAPYQHESVTAALAKAISESPPSIRATRPDVPKALDRLVLKGLERDRKRRFNTLEDLRDALQGLMPEEQVSARTRMLFAAYVLDTLLTLFLVTLPIELLEWAAGLRSWLFGGEMMLDPLATLGYLLYFASCEGFVGVTVGKWLLGLRVVPHGSVGPPGFGRATLRTGLFHFGWMLIWIALFPVSDMNPAYGVLIGLALVVGGTGYLAYRIRTPESNRGLHDLATGTHVVQNPRRPHRVRLISHGPSRIERAARVPGMPRELGGNTLRGRLASLEGNCQLWLADDRSLGRRVLVHLAPAETETVLPPARPNRLRLIGNGELEWNASVWTWNAFAAPAGAPLRDMIHKDEPLDWPDARLLIEQLVEELLASTAENNLPPRVSLNHVWTEPAGRVLLLDFPIPPSSAEEATDVELVREVTTLLLEGSPRRDGGRVKAPLPPRALAVVNRLFEPVPTSLETLQSQLADSHGTEPTVTRKLRTTQLGLAAMLLAMPLIIMFAYTTFIGYAAATISWSTRQATRGLLRDVESPTTLAKLQSHEELRQPLVDALPATRQRLREFRDAQDRDFARNVALLSKPERYVMGRTLLASDADSEPTLTYPKGAQAVLTAMNATPDERRGGELKRALLGGAVFVCGGLAVLFALCAFLFRGGLSYTLGGVALVRRDGRRANRFVCALRELVLWLPVIVLLLLAAYLQLQWPAWFLSRLVVTALAIILLIVYVGVGLRHPEQGWFDRRFGLTRVPL